MASNSLESLYENPAWAQMRKYTFQPPNGGHYERWPQGSIGGNSPMPLYSNEYAHLYMKHGQNDLLSYTGGIKNFAPSVTRHLQNQVHTCSNLTLNPAGCQQNAVGKVFSQDSHHPGAIKPHMAGLTAANGRLTPSPLNISYQLGYSRSEFPSLPPWGPQS